MGVKTEHKDYQEMSLVWERCDDVFDGQDAVHEAGPKYLPKLSKQEDADYKSYVARATFFNASYRTLSGLLGMIFRKVPLLEAPANVLALLNDVDMAGTPFNQFAYDVAEEALKYGRVGLLVDHPAAPSDTMTLAQAEAYGMRPKILIYGPEDIINWRTSRINNRTVLSMVVLAEEEEFHNGFEAKTEDRWRVLSLEDGVYVVRVYKVDEKGNDVMLSQVVPQINGKPLNHIPFQFVGVDDLSPDVDLPPLIDLVDLNLAHYRVTADYEHGCHYTGLPTAWVAGHRPDTGDEKLYIGSGTAWVFPDPATKVGFLEFSGQGLGALVDNLDRKEKQMAVLGLRMLEQQKRAAEAAETAAIHRSGEQSQLAQMAQTISMGITNALQWFTNWAGGGTVKFEINKDFVPKSMTAQDLTALVASWQHGAISHQSLFENLQKGEVVAADVTFEEEQARIQESAPVIGGAG